MSLLDLWRPLAAVAFLDEVTLLPNGPRRVLTCPVLSIGVPHQRHLLGFLLPRHPQEVQQVLRPAGTPPPPNRQMIQPSAVPFKLENSTFLCRLRPERVLNPLNFGVFLLRRAAQ